MKTTIIFLAFFLFFFDSPTVALAQMETAGMGDVFSKLQLKSNIDGKLESIYTNIEGSPFMFKDFNNGSVKFMDGEIYNGMFRFDKYAGEIHFKKEDEIFAVAFPKKLEYIEIEDVRFIYSDFKLSESMLPDEDGAYFVVLIDNKCKLLAQKNTSIKAAQPSKGIVEGKPAKFIDKNDTYYIKIGDLPAISIKKNNSLIYIFGDKEAEISKFINTEKISSKKLKDLEKLVNYYNTLI